VVQIIEMIMADFFISLLPTVQHLGFIGYWLVSLVSFAESLAFIGVFVPGGILVILFGFLSSQGYLDLGDLIWFAAIGAILGDSVSYWLGSKGTRFFRNENRILKLSHLEKGEQFFKKYGEKSILLGRFVGPMRPIVPFVAGLFKMRQRTFLFWNIVSGFLWASVYLLLGYFFGGAVRTLEAWTTRAGFFAFIVLFFILIIWFLIKRIRPIFVFFVSIAVSIKNAAISNPDVQKIIKKHPRIFAFIKRRFSRKRFSGLPLTLIFFAFIYAASLLFGIIEDIITLDPIVAAADIRVANLFYAFRNMELIKFFTWVTLLGKWEIVISGAITSTIILWFWRKKTYALALWVTLFGSEILNLLGKFTFHRPRPEIAYYAEHGFSFPSGHATIALAFYGFLTYIILRETKKWGRKATILFCGLIVILSIGLSRLYLGVHYVSDVWGGYLSGLLFLIIGIALVEWIKSWRHNLAQFEVSRGIKIATIILIFAEVVFYVVFAFQYHPPLNKPQREQTAIVENILSLFQKNELPQFTETLLGNKQEPINFIIFAKEDTELVNVMNRAGWLLADKATAASVFMLAKSVVSNEAYPTAPITPSFWNASPHDFGFEKETAAQNVKERHHVRFWKTNLQTPDGKRVYVGTASFNNGIKWLVIHKISPDIDTERELLFADLQSTGDVVNSSKESFVTPLLGENFSGDAFFTDGKVYLVALESR
jgi:undecaprenyl-diphosphatase